MLDRERSSTTADAAELVLSARESLVILPVGRERCAQRLEERLYAVAVRRTAQIECTGEGGVQNRVGRVLRGRGQTGRRLGSALSVTL